MTNLWDGTYENNPADTDIIGEGNEEFQTLKKAIRERMANDHEMVTTDGSGQVRHGLHKQGSARLYVSASAPTALPNETALGSSDVGRLWFKTGDATLWEYDAVTPWVQIKVDTAALIANAVTNEKLRKSEGLSVIGRSANTTDNVADISAASDGDVLRRSGSTLGFGTVATAGLADDAVTNAKLANMAVNTIKGRVTSGTGDPEDLSQASVQAIIGIDTAIDLGGVSPSDTKLSSQKAVKNYADAIASGGSTLYAPKDHKSTDTTYGVGSATNYGHVKVDAAPTDASDNAVASNGVFDALAGKAPTDHKSTATTYGQGDASNYGHVKVDTTAANGSLNAVSSDALYDEIQLARNASNLSGGTLPNDRLAADIGTRRISNATYVNIDGVGGQFKTGRFTCNTDGDITVTTGFSVVVGAFVNIPGVVTPSGGSSFNFNRDEDVAGSYVATYIAWGL